MPRTITDDELTQVRTKNPGARILSVVPEDSADGTPGDDYVFKAGTKADYLRYKQLIRQSMAGGSGAGQEATLYARGLCVWPSPEAFDELREAFPALAEELGQTLLEKARGGLEVREGKR
ncbi:MAG: hypothetical protein Q8S73_42970 [Deltaproteobacteria bacterium]|nr:hypothetical protein [Myxococcales bacterium]MDP3220925.1 hypothetical protein [Deltaproteobacteria bacterium]